MKQHSLRLNLARAAALIIWIGAGAFLITHRTQLTPQAIQTISPENRFLLILFLLLLYAGKTLSLVFPLKVPQLAAGLLLPAHLAVLINLLGTGVSAQSDTAWGGCSAVTAYTASPKKIRALPHS